MHHFKFSEIRTLVSHNIPTLLTGEKGSGKTTLAMNIAKYLDLTFYGMSMTRQTTLSHLMGFINVNGDYVPSQLYKAATEGGMFLIDEIDAADSNVLLVLNTIENGYLSFPVGVHYLHENFRLVATSNPQDQHKDYVGRNKLDAATLDRFDIVEIPRDPNLELLLVDPHTVRVMDTLRQILKNNNSSKVVSMRDSLRYQKRKSLQLTEGFFERIIGDDPVIISEFEQAAKAIPKHFEQADCDTALNLWELITASS